MYVQSERQAEGIYLSYAKELIEKGEAYYCFCDKERLEGLKETVAGKEISIYDKHCLGLSKEEIEEKLEYRQCGTGRYDFDQIRRIPDL